MAFPVLEESADEVYQRLHMNMNLRLDGDGAPVPDDSVRVPASGPTRWRGRTTLFFNRAKALCKSANFETGWALAYKGNDCPDIHGSADRVWSL